MVLSEYFATMEALTSIPDSDPSAMPSFFAQGFCGAVGNVEIAVECEGNCGATGEAVIPLLAVYAVDDSFNTTAAGDCTLPAFQGEAYVCGLDSPIANGATSAAIVNLLQQGNAVLAAAAANICAYDDTDDERAMSVVYFVSNLMAYVSDGDGVGDRWTCALATWLRKYGDCEDGAILIHSLLLAAGVNPNRLRTAFGTAMTTALTETGHAWVMCRRLTDEEWIPLEWTVQPSPYDVEAWQINRQVDMTGSYTAISYILTNEKFSAVTDPNYIANLVPNHASGAVAIPDPICAGTTNLVATGEVTLPALTASGRCGARGAVTIPAVSASGTASQINVARGVVTIPSMTASGRCGARGAITLSALTAMGQCGTSARGAVVIPVLTATGSATVGTVARGAVSFPKFVLSGHAVVGAMAHGAVALPVLEMTARAAQGPVAWGDVTIPALTCEGWAVGIVANGEVVLPALACNGYAVAAASLATTLRYDSRRWV